MCLHWRNTLWYIAGKMNLVGVSCARLLASAGLQSALVSSLAKSAGTLPAYTSIAYVVCCLGVADDQVEIELLCVSRRAMSIQVGLYLGTCQVY